MHLYLPSLLLGPLDGIYGQYRDDVYESLLDDQH